MKECFEKKQLIKKSKDFSKWYTDIIIRSELADYSPLKGCMVFMPYGFAIWENIRKELDMEIKKAGVKNAYFPSLIPEKLLKKESSHIKGFSPELAIITIGGGKKLKEKIIIRPTSETIIYEMYAKWIKSWRDLPLAMNQWCNVIRWEKRPRLFLRTIEFLWQEAHTVHCSYSEAEKESKRAINMYADFYREFFAIDGILGEKSELERFPGAKSTYTYEMLMPDNKALQGCTSHNLAQNFSKPFNIRFLDKEGNEKIPYQTSWGLSTRSIGALIMVHSDDQGLIIPPRLAPIQVVIIPIFHDKTRISEIEKKSEEIKNILKNFRVEIDKRKNYSVGWKFNEWELKGVPLRIEIGKKEIEKNQIILVSRDSGEKISVSYNLLESKTKKALDLIQENLFKKSREYLKENTKEVSDYKDFKNIMNKKRGFLKAFWCENPKCEAKIKEETKATVRCLPINSVEEKGKCIYCGKKASRKWIFALAY
ncbi:MAG: proline--tRNA ligase [Patescibacteria group bacterium]|nr:proline--tRNA ligase [Patescibacteria group bacterium]